MSKMFDISYTDSKIVVRAEQPFLPAIKIFLKNLGFSGEEGRMECPADDPQEIISSTIEMLEMCGGGVILDHNCKQMVNDAEDSKNEFMERLATARSLKGHGKEYWENLTINVPKMLSNMSLKWYQKMCVMHAVTLGNSANFSVPGSGKTWMALSTFLKMKYEDNIVDKLLVVSPLAAFRPWETECDTMTGKDQFKIVRITGTPNEREHLFMDLDYEGNDILLVSHAMVARETENLIKVLKNSRFLMVVDESHNIKMPHGQRATAIHQIGKYAVKRMILTGTPIPKNIKDLWSQFHFLYPDDSVLPAWPQYEFKCTTPTALEDISSTVSQYFTRVSKDMLNLPRPTFNPENNGNPTVVPMSPIQRRIYDAIALKIRDNVDNFRDDAVAMERYRKNSMIYLIEAATDPSLLTKDTTYDTEELDTEGLNIVELLSKYPRLKEESLNKLETATRMAINTVNTGGKVIIWCSFINTIKKMSKRMSDLGYESESIWGGVPRDEEVDPKDNRERRIENFKNDYKCNILIANPASLAESISLHKHCHHAIYVDRTFNGAHYMQSLDRIHRVGLEHDTRVRYDIIQSDRSVDQTIHDRLMTKQKKMESFLNMHTLDIFSSDDWEGVPNVADDDYQADFEAVVKDIGKHVSV